jgi:hypothetical protein
MASGLHGTMVYPTKCGQHHEVVEQRSELYSSPHIIRRANFNSIVRSQASASSGSSALLNNGGWVLRKS